MTKTGTKSKCCQVSVTSVTKRNKWDLLRLDHKHNIMSIYPPMSIPVNRNPIIKHSESNILQSVTSVTKNFVTHLNPTNTTTYGLMIKSASITINLSTC